MPGAPEPQASLCFAWKTEGLVTICDTATSPSSGREGGKRTSGQLLCAPHPAQRHTLTLTPTSSSQRTRFPSSSPSPKTDSRAPTPVALWPTAQAPGPWRGTAAVVYRALTIALCGLEHPTVCPHPTPAPVCASLHPLPEPGSSPGLAKEAPWAPTRARDRHLCHTHTHTEPGGCTRCRRPASRPRYQPHPQPPCHWAPQPCDCSNRPRLPPHHYSNGRTELLGGGRPAWRAGGRAARGASGYGQAQVQPHVGAPSGHHTRGPQGGQTLVP